MAAHERIIPKTSIPSQTLLNKLATVLPNNVSFKIYHLSTPPTKASSLYSAPPGTRPDRTYCESHFLAASIPTPKTDDSEPRDVLIFAIEILVYSTAHDTTFFVSKADSTGYLHLLGLAKGTPSPLRDISATFLRHLVEEHQRPKVRSIVSLFARAQDQYLFPGSVKYSGKHVLDDRGLVRWWCRVLDPLIEPNSSNLSTNSQWNSIDGYLIVPGLDTHETLSYTPRKSTAIKSSWTIGHPLERISRYPHDVPPRCLIPHYPDDPKARFLDELDEEVTKGKNASSGHWKSVKSIDQFWDMMAFRQECSAGRLVGFIWIVFEAKTQQEPTESFVGDSQTTAATDDDQVWDMEAKSSVVHDRLNVTSSAATSFNASSQPHLKSSSPKPNNRGTSSNKDARTSRSRTPTQKKKLSGPIIPRQPRVKTEQKRQIPKIPESTLYYTWPPNGRGQVVVEESDYKRVTELLLHLEFKSLNVASSSSGRWISEVRSSALGTGRKAWGQDVIGTYVVETRAKANVSGVNSLNMGLVRKKRKPGAEETKENLAVNDTPHVVNVLSSGMIRKKPKA